MFNEIEIIRLIQQIRFGFLDTIMKLITELGDQMVFIGIALVIYWFFDKKLAFKLVFTFIFSAMINEGLKAIVKRPRPYVEDMSLNVGEPTHGYSFPSGHSQNTAVISTVLYQSYGKKNNWLKWVLLAAMILVPFTRMYLGQHYLTDVLVGLLVGVVVAILVGKLVDMMKDREHVYGLLILIPLVIGVGILAFMNPVYDEVKNLYVAVGGLSGFMAGYALDKLKIKYDYKPTGIKVLWRALIGLAGVAILYVGLSAIFKAIISESLILDFVRYAAIGFFGAAGSIYIFKLLKV